MVLSVSAVSFGETDSIPFYTSDSIPLLERPYLGPEQDAESADNDLQPLDLSGEIYVTPVNHSLAPRVFNGYRNLYHPTKYTTFPDSEIASKVARQLWRIDSDKFSEKYSSEDSSYGKYDYRDLLNPIPNWLRRSLDTYRFQDDFIYSVMISNPSMIEYAYWDLPTPPVIPEEDYSFMGYIKRLNLPPLKPEKALPVHNNGERINWLHTFNIALQLSQAYVSSNWYQGGNSHLSFHTNFLWDVMLNNVYHPNVIFQSTASYKLSINSTTDDEYHKYSVSQDLFQYNLKAGYRAVHNWYYSFTTQFKTQFFNSYPSNSQIRSASFLAPGELNLGLGLTYSKENASKSIRFSASISPVSYNLKTCIDSEVEHSQFGIRPDRKFVNEYGSNAEVNFFARIFDNTTYTTRLFLFSDYNAFHTDWENTLNFQFSRLFSTQIYAHLRYDTSTDSSISKGWKKLMLNEILSVGISYTFSTK